MRFVAVEVETANPNMSSICQIGLVQFEDGQETRCESMLVDPQTWFDPYNVNVHGIDEAVVRGAATFPQLQDRLHDWTANQVVVCHTHFDRVALHQACTAATKSPLACTWLDSARVTRRTWPQSRSAATDSPMSRHSAVSSSDTTMRLKMPARLGSS